VLHNQRQWIHGTWLGLLRISLEKKISLRFINFQGAVQVLHEDLETLVADLTKSWYEGTTQFPSEAKQNCSEGRICLSRAGEKKHFI